MSSSWFAAPMAGGVAFALAFSSPAAAETSGDASASMEAHDLDAVQVTGQRIEKASSSKYTGLLRDTPQSITTIDRQTVQEQNLHSLQDILATLPGITFGAGEGGGGFGDKINLRGFDASNDITVDGVRDSGLYSRTDPFNLEAVEVINGANSVYSGAGSVGGTVNLVSKVAQGSEFNRFTVGVGTDDYARVTGDSNMRLGENAALRLNVMAHRNDIPGRDVEKFERWGVAPSLTLGIGTDTSWSLGYVHQQDDNIPMYGVPYYNGRPVPGVDRANYYGYRNLDTQQIELDALTSILTHAFSDTLSVRNLSRWQQVDQFSLVDATQGTWCLSTNVTPLGGPCESRNSTTGAFQYAVPAGQYAPSGPRGYGRDTRNVALYNQTDVTVDFATGPVAHTLVAGASFLHETFDLDTTSDLRNADGSNPYVGTNASNHLPFMDLYNPSGIYTGPLNRTLTARTAGELDNRAFYAFDTLKFGPKWQLNLGARYERNEGSSVASVVQPTAADGSPIPGKPAIGTVTAAGIPADNADNLFSYRAGLVYKPVEAASLYAAYGNSKTPSKASVNGSCTAVATSTAGVNCNVDPETAVSYELGAKWDAMGGRLALTGSLFRNERSNYRLNDPDPTNLAGVQSLDGKARVDGLMLGVSGLITDRWSVFANYTHLDSKVLRGVSAFCLANPGYTNPTTRQACGNSVAAPDPTRGDALMQVPGHSFSLWTTYDISRQWQLGYGATYQGELLLTQHTAANPDGPLVSSDAYWVHRAMVAYKVNRTLGFQLNINNLFDKEYYTRIRNNGWATPGDARSVVLTANIAF